MSKLTLSVIVNYIWWAELMMEATVSECEVITQLKAPQESKTTAVPQQQLTRVPSEKSAYLHDNAFLR